MDTLYTFHITSSVCVCKYIEKDHQASFKHNCSTCTHIYTYICSSRDHTIPFKIQDSQFLSVY